MAYILYKKRHFECLKKNTTNQDEYDQQKDFKKLLLSTLNAKSVRTAGLDQYVEQYAILGRKLPYYIFNMPTDVEKKVRERIIKQRKMLNKYEALSDEEVDEEFAFLRDLQDDVFETNAYKKQAFVYEDQQYRLTPKLLVEIAMVEIKKSIKIEKLQRLKETKDARNKL